MNKLVTFLPVLYLAVGYLIINYASEIIHIPELAEEAIWVLGLVFLNIFISLTHRLNLEFIINFSPAKLPHLIVGFLLGLIPTGAVLAFWVQTDLYWVFWWDWEFGYLVPFLIKALLLELWFRSMPLEIASQRWSQMTAGLVFSFAAVVLLNLEMLIVPQPQALTHFLMNFTLCIIFLLYRSFWMSLGMQLAFVIIPTLINYEGSNKSLIYHPIYLMLMTILAAIFSIKAWRKFNL